MPFSEKKKPNHGNKFVMMTTSDHSNHNFTKYANLPSIGRLSLANTTNNATVPRTIQEIPDMW
jgi:hypothetical protein